MNNLDNISNELKNPSAESEIRVKAIDFMFGYKRMIEKIEDKEELQQIKERILLHHAELCEEYAECDYIKSVMEESKNELLRLLNIQETSINLAKISSFLNNRMR